MVVENAEAIDFRRKLLKRGLTYEEYSEIRREFIEKNEGSKTKAYDDERGIGDPYRYAKDLFIAKKEGRKEIVGDQQVIVDVLGKITVGIGFNMGNDSKGANRKREARKQWDKAFHDLKPESRPDFDKVFKGEEVLEQNKINKLFDVIVKEKEIRLRKHFTEKLWNKLKANERLAVEDMYYNLESLVTVQVKKDKNGKIYTEEVSFSKNIKNYLTAEKEEDRKKYLHYAVWEVTRNSNAKRLSGLDKRRFSEGYLLDTYGINIETIETPPYVRGEVAEDVRKVRDSIGNMLPTAEEIGGKVMNISNNHLEQFKQEARRKLNREVNISEAHLDKKIKEIEARYNREIEDLKKSANLKIEEMFKQGLNKGSIIEGLKKIKEEFANKSAGFAEDMPIITQQILDKFFHNEAGFTHYRWVTSHDNKVRESHILNDGRIFSWGRLPERTGHPGEDYNCRCHAEIVTDQEILSQERQEAKTLQELRIFLKNPPLVHFIYANK